MRRIEVAVGIPVAQRTDTTSTLGERHRTVSVNQLVKGLLLAIAVADVIGAILIALR